MKAVLGKLPAPDHDWAYEIKWDGYRTLAFIEHGELRLQSSSGRDVTANYPELAGLPDSVHATTAVLDGELVVLDDEGRPDFGAMQRHERQAAFYVFDVLQVGEHQTTELPYEDRRRLLEQLVEAGPNWMVPSHRVGGGAELVAVTYAQGLEGVMAKRLGSPYQVGQRSNHWLKIKHRRQVDVVIGGYTVGEGNRSSTFGSLLVGRPDGGRLTFAGGVGTGFDQAMLEALSASLRDITIDDCPFEPVPPPSYRRNARWVTPTLGATIEVAEFTNDGLARHASFTALTSPPQGPS